MRTEILAILDASGSMHTLLDDSIGGFNAFLQTQRESNPEDKITVVFFDSDVKVAFESIPLKDMEPLTKETYKAGTMTALYDAIGVSMHKLGVRLSSLPVEDRPDKVMVAILTDGFENDSKEYDSDKVGQMIQHQKDKYGWGFVYLAANEAGLQSGTNIGLARDAVSFTASSEGLSEAYRAISVNTTAYRQA